MGKSVLYYPSIKITRKDWLNNALFYWDNIYSIVPDNYDWDKFTPELKYLLDEHIFIPLSPSILLKSNSYNRFETELLETLLWSRHENIVNNIIHSVEPTKRSVVYLSKMRNYVWDYMEENHIIKRCFDKFAVMSEEDSFIIMSLMAKYMTCEYNTNHVNNVIVPSTDKPESYKYAFDTYSRKRNYVSTLNNVLPTPIPNLPLERIIDFRNENKNELIKLRLLISEHEEKISKCEEISDVTKILNEFQEKVFVELNLIKETLRRKKITYCLTSLRTIINISIPSMLVSLNEVPVSLKALGVVANGVISLGVCYADNVINKSDFQNSPVAYLYNARKMGLLDFYNFN